MARIVEQTNQLTAAAWAGDFLDRDHMIPGGAKLDPAQFVDTDAVVVNVGAAAQWVHRYQHPRGCPKRPHS